MMKKIIIGLMLCCYLCMFSSCSNDNSGNVDILTSGSQKENESEDTKTDATKDGTTDEKNDDAGNPVDGVLGEERKEITVMIEKNEIIYNGQSFSNASVWLSALEKEEGSLERVHIILIENNAVVNTMDAVVNILIENGAMWSMPTPVPET